MLTKHPLSFLHGVLPQAYLSNTHAPYLNHQWLGFLKGHSQLWYHTDLDNSFSHFDKGSPQPEIKVHLEFHFNICSVFLDQPFTEKPVFEFVFTHPIMLFLSYLVKSSMDCVSVICKLAMKWYLMRMCAS